MEITYLGHSSFRIKTASSSVVTDPFDSKIGFKFPNVNSEIVTVSHDHFDHNQVNLVSEVRKVIDGPGEYEISGISIIGMPTYHDNKKGELRGKNTVYIFEAEGIRLAHLGDLGHILSDKKIEELGEINILMIPVGGEFTIGSDEASRVVRSVEPQITIPMHYRTSQHSSDFSKLEILEEFLKEIGMTVQNLPKLSVKASDLSDDQKVVVLERK